MLKKESVLIYKVCFARSVHLARLPRTELDHTRTTDCGDMSGWREEFGEAKSLSEWVIDGHQVPPIDVRRILKDYLEEVTRYREVAEFHLLIQPISIMFNHCVQMVDECTWSAKLMLRALTRIVIKSGDKDLQQSHSLECARILRAFILSVASVIYDEPSWFGHVVFDCDNVSSSSLGDFVCEGFGEAKSPSEWVIGSHQEEHHTNPRSIRKDYHAEVDRYREMAELVSATWGSSPTSDHKERVQTIRRCARSAKLMLPAMKRIFGVNGGDKDLYQSYSLECARILRAFALSVAIIAYGE